MSSLPQRWFYALQLLPENMTKRIVTLELLNKVNKSMHYWGGFFLPRNTPVLGWHSPFNSAMKTRIMQYTVITGRAVNKLLVKKVVFLGMYSSAPCFMKISRTMAGPIMKMPVAKRDHDSWWGMTKFLTVLSKKTPPSTAYKVKTIDILTISLNTYSIHLPILSKGSNCLTSLMDISAGRRDCSDSLLNWTATSDI